MRKELQEIGLEQANWNCAVVDWMMIRHGTP
jgi:hypothetical protein